MTTDTVPAADTGLPSITRRAALAGLALASVAASTPARADAVLDPLIGLGATFDRAHRAYSAANEAFATADDVVMDARGAGLADPGFERAYDDADQLVSDTGRACSSLLEEMARTPAVSFPGLRAKCAALRTWDRDAVAFSTEGAALALSIAADFLALNPDART